MSDSHATPPAAHDAAAGHGAPAHEHAHQGPSYYLIFAALVVLTAVTVGVSYITGLSSEAALIIAMAIASLKATLVALFFMHLKFEIKPIYIVVGVPVVLTIILIIALMPDIAYHQNPTDIPAAAPAAEAHP